MKGTIEIKLDGASIEIHAKTTPLHKIEKLLLIDALVEGLKLDEEERFIAGATIAVGGVETVLGVGANKVEIDMTALKNILEKKGFEGEAQSS